MSSIKSSEIWKNIAVVASASIIGVGLFLAVDFFFGARILELPTKVLSLEEKPYFEKEDGWYELKPNFVGYDQLGPYMYEVETNSFGFRKEPRTADPKKYDVLFLGDSFVYGANGRWENTFVGMFSKSSSLSVLNGGVGSYSPTAYLYQYKKALQLGLLGRGHTIVVAVDISDVQDEAGIWIDGDLHPRKTEDELLNRPLASEAVGSFRLRMKESFPLIRTIFRFIRHYVFDPDLRSPTTLINLPRSAFTHQEWSTLEKKNAWAAPHEGYAPLGVAGGLEKIERKISEISQLAKSNDAKLYLLVYPWPAQIANKDKFSWSDFMSGFCLKISCDGVIDTIPVFRDLALKETDWMEKYYIRGDIHFTTKGNRIVADKLVEVIPHK